MGKEVQWTEKHIGTTLLPLLGWPLAYVVLGTSGHLHNV